MSRLVLFVLVLLVSLATAALPALAHERREVGRYTFVVGWRDEPALEGILNAVFVRVTETAGGRGVEGLDQTLKVQVTYGGQTQTFEPPLRAARADPGSYSATIIPTRAGDYTFRFSGKVGELSVDERFESGPQRFDPIRAPTDLQFPERLGSVAELARELRAARSNAETAQSIGAFAIALGGSAVFLALAALTRSRK